MVSAWDERGRHEAAILYKDHDADRIQRQIQCPGPPVIPGKTPLRLCAFVSSDVSASHCSSCHATLVSAAWID
eukprot:3066-Eustigmatos_ZCMA.PRE.1